MTSLIAPGASVNDAYKKLNALCDVWAIAAEAFGDSPALVEPHRQPEVQLTFRDLKAQLESFAKGLQALGIQPGDRISLFADNSARWFIADQGSMLAGAVDVVRSSQADSQELAYILDHSGSSVAILETAKTLEAIAPFLPDLSLKWIGLLSDETPPDDIGLPIYNYQAIHQAGANQALTPIKRDLSQLATLLYTSGTTGRPKGVMLTHGNLMHQLTVLPEIIQPQLECTALSILPTWHSFGRIVDYFLLSQGCRQVLYEYSTYQDGLTNLSASIYGQCSSSLGITL